MADRKTVENNIKKLYNDAVEYKMFKAATPSFSEFRHRMMGDGYQKLVFDNYKKAGIDSPNFKDINAFRGAYSLNHTDEAKQRAIDKAQGIVDLSKDRQRFVQLNTQKMLDKAKKPLKTKVDMSLNVKNPLKNDNLIKDPDTGDLYTTEGEKFAATDRYLVGTPETEAVKAQNAIDIENLYKNFDESTANLSDAALHEIGYRPDVNGSYDALRDELYSMSPADAAKRVKEDVGKLKEQGLTDIDPNEAVKIFNQNRVEDEFLRKNYKDAYEDYMSGANHFASESAQGTWGQVQRQDMMEHLNKFKNEREAWRLYNEKNRQQAILDRANANIFEKLQQTDKERERFRREHPFLAFARDWGRASLDIRRGMNDETRNDFAYTMNERAAANKAETNIRDINESLNWLHGNQGKVGRAVRGAVRGMKNIDTYDFAGLSAASDAKAVYNAADRWSRGVATPQDDDLLAAVVVQNAIQDEHSDALGGMYGAGVGLAENARFIAAMFANPFNGIGKAAAKKAVQNIARWSLKKFGKGLTSKIATSIAKYGTRVGMDLVEAGVGAELFGQGKIMADYINRQTGDIKSDGHGGYVIEKPKETPSESLYKAHMSNAIEWASEMWGEYLPGIGDIGGWLGKTVGKGANKAFGYDKILNFFNKYPTEAWSKSFRQFQERTHWDGMIGEYAEEVMGNMANALTVGDMTWDSAPGTGVFNKKINTDTFLSVALMCGIMSGVNTAGYATYRYRAGKALDRADAAGQTVLGGKWGSIKDRIDNADERETRSILDEVKNNNDLNDTQKRIIYHYAMQLAYYHGTNLQDMKNKAEGRDNARQNAYGEGRAAQGEDKHEAQSELKAKTASLAQLLGVSEEELSNMSDEQLESLTGEDDDTDNAIYDYQMSRARMQGVEDEAKDNADNAAAEAETRVGQMTDKSTDTVRPAKMAGAQGEEDREVYIVSGDLETHEDGSIDKSNSSGMILYYDPQTGQIEHGDASMFTEVGEARPASEVMDEEANAARQRVLADNKAETDGIVRVGSTYHVLGEDGQTHEYRVLSQNEDGTVNVSVDGTQITSTIEQLQELRNQSDEARNQAQVNDDVRSDEEPVSPDEGNTSVEDKTTEETAPAEDNMPYESIVNQQTGRVVPVTVEDEDGAPRFSDAQGVFLYNGKEKGNANDRLGIIVVDRDGNTTKYIVKRKYVSTDGSMSLDDYKEYRSPVAPVEDNTTEETAPVDNNTETPAIDETQPTSDETQAPTATDEAQPATGTEPPAESVTLRDGTTVSMREDGNPAYEQMTPEQGADFYRDEFGEDARQVLEDEVKAAEDALNKAKETKVEGANFKEKKAAQEAKADAVKRVQLEYDTKKAFLDSFNDNKYETREEGRVVSDEERAELVNQNTVDDNVADIIMGKGVRKTLQKIADMMGVKLVFLQTADTNGWFDQKSNTIYVALDADKALSSVFGHEMTHEIKAHNDEAYQSLKDVCKKLIANAEGNFDNLVMMKRVSYAKQGVVLSVEDAEEEVVADAIGGTINNLDLAKSIAFRLSHPVLAHIQNVLTRILGKLGLTSPLYEKFRDVRDTIAQAYVDTMPKEEVEAEEEAQNNGNSFSLRLQSAIDETEREPSDAQKESGNYKKGHVKFGGYDFTIENPKGSYRSGRDADGKEWKQKMNDTYGYIRGTYGKDGDHLDMFINDKADLDNWNGNVYVVDQVNKDGSFDEHKVMYGFDSEEDAKKAYLSNYEKGWQGLGNITGVSKDAFDKWLDSSSRKTKPFAEYSGVKNEQAQSEETDLKPVGVGAFGNIYNQFRGKAKAAIKFLKKLGSGEAVAALHHHSIGDISLVWGDKKTGLAKILKKHPEVVGNLQSIIDKMDVVQESDNRIKLESPTHFAVISREYKGEPRENWLLTAYEKRDSLENGKSMDTATTSLGDDTALSQSKESSANISNSSETSKEKGEKFSLREDESESRVYSDKAGVPTQEELGEGLSEEVKDYVPQAVPWNRGVLYDGQESPIKYSARGSIVGIGMHPLVDSDGKLKIVDGMGREFDKNHPVSVDDLKRTDSALNAMVDICMSNGTLKDPDVFYQKYADFVNRLLEKGDRGFSYVSDQWMWEGEALYRSVHNNGDEQYAKSIDITRICKKNEAVIHTISELQKRQGYGVTVGQILDIYNQTVEDGYQAPCPVCYVFSRYLRNGVFASTLVAGQRRYGDMLVDPRTLSDKEKRKRVDYWVKELGKLEQFYEENKKAIGQAKIDIQNIFTEVDRLAMDITSGKLKGKELADAKKRIGELDKRYRAAVDLVSVSDLTGYIKSMAIEKKGGQWTLRTDSWKHYPEDVALDITRAQEAIVEFPGVQRYRNSHGSAAGKSIQTASNNDLGDTMVALGLNNPEKRDKRSKQLSHQNLLLKAFADETTNAERTKLLNMAKKDVRSAMVYAAQQALRGGIRQWSWSDNVERLSPDVFMNLMQVGMLGGALQAYSKQLEGVELVASMNGYVNGSLMGKGKGYREVDKDFKDAPVYYNERDGKYYTLDFDDVVGIEPFSRNGKLGLFDLNKMYDRAGNILVGMNDIHTRAAMADPRVFFIIPWHSSGMTNHILYQFYNYLGVDTNGLNAQDYTKVQEEKTYGADEDVPQEVTDFWESHNYGGKYRSGIGEIPSGKGKLSPQQIHYRELKGALMLHNSLVLDRPASEIRSKADREDYKFWTEHRDWLDEIKNDEFLSLALAKVQDTVNVHGASMTKGDTEFVYPYEYWDAQSTEKNADVNGERYMEYCRRLGMRPKFIGITNNGTVDFGNFCEDPGYWKLLIDRRMYDRKGNFQDLTPVTVDGFNVDMVDPEKTKERFDVTRVAELDKISDVVDHVQAREQERGIVPEVDYGQTLKKAVDKYNKSADKKFSLRGNKGYVGNSKSVRAVDAENRGLRPKSRIDADFVDEVREIVKGRTGSDSQITLKDVREIANKVKADEWHHTGVTFNRTDYYSSESIADYITSEDDDRTESLRSKYDDISDQMSQISNELMSAIRKKAFDGKGKFVASNGLEVEANVNDVIRGEAYHPRVESTPEFNKYGVGEYVYYSDLPSLPQNLKDEYQTAVSEYNNHVKQVRESMSDEFSTYDTLGEERNRIQGEMNSIGMPKFSLREHKQKQLDIINVTNPMLDDYHTGIRNVEDIKTFAEAMDEARKDAEKYEYDEWSSYPDEDNEMLQDALNSGVITIYSSKPIVNGNFVTPSRMQAEDYAGGRGNKVYEKTVPVTDVAWINVEEGQYAKVDNGRFSLKEVNDRFNSDLKNFIEKGIFPENSRFELGFPSNKLLSAGFPNLPISMRVSLLNKKAGMERHPFSPSDMYDMVDALQTPIAVFEYTKDNMRNLIIDLTRNGKHFLVGVTLNYRKGELAVNSISGLFPKENHEWIKWIQDGKAIRIDQKEKVLSLIDSLRTNPEEAERIGLNLDSAAKIVRIFKNPNISEENVSSGPKFSLRQSYDDRLSDWKKRNGFAPDEKPMDKPVRGQNESIGDFMVRMADYAKNAALWKTAPRPSGYREALEQWKKDNGIPADEYRPAIPRKADYATDDEYRKARDQYKQEMDKWKGAPKASDYDLSVDLDGMAGKLTAIASAMLNQRSFDRQTIEGITDMVKTMLALGWGDRMTRGKIGNLLVQLKRMNGNTANAKEVINETMGILADNYIKNLEAAYKKMTSNKGVRKDDTGVIRIGSLDAEGQAIIDEHNKALTMSDADIAQREGDLLDALTNGTMNDTLANARLEGIRLAKLYRSTISTANADIDTLTKQIRSLSEKKNKTKAERELLQSLKSALTSVKIDKARMYLDMLGEMGADVRQSKEGAKKFRENVKKHRNHILGLAEEDMEGMDATELSTDNWKKKFWNNPIVRTVMAPTTTFEQMLKFFGMHKNVNGEGRLYNYFMQKWHDAADEQQVYNEANRKALDDKVKELFGKYSFIDLVGKESKEFPGMDIEVYDLGNTTDPNNPNKRKVHLKQGQMLYIYLVNKEADGAMKLRAMGITEQDVDDIENRIHPKMKELGDWLQQEYLPECQRRYQETHMKYFGAPMAEVENYFPLVINPNARRQAMDVSDQNAGNTQLSGLTTGAIVTRRVNTTPLDIENADALAVAWSHLDEMEEWSAMLPFRQDINTLLSFKKFRNQVKNLSSMAYGNGEELWKNFVAVSQIAAGTYDAKTAGKEYDRIVQKAIGLVAMAKISGRLWTAFKQTLSAPAFLPDVGVIGLPQYLWNTVTFPMTFVWAKKNLPLFRKRIDSLTAGDPRIKATLDSFGKQKSKFLKFAQFGMMPNIGIDALTCAVGAKTVYDVWKSKLLRQGYPEARAEEKAALKASLAYNKSQQSSEGAFMSTMQVDRTYLAATMSLFKNSNYAYGRNIIEAARGLANSWQFWGKHRKAIIASMTAQIQAEEGFDEGTARKIATSAYNNAKWHNIGVLATYGAILPILWSLGGNMLYLLMGDDDDKKKHMLEEAAWKGTLTSLTDDYAIPFASNIINAGIYSDEEGVHFNFDSMKNQNLYVNPTKSDIANILNSMAYGNMKEAGYGGSLLLAQAFMGFNPATLGNIMQAFLERNVKDSNRNEVFLAEFLNAPESNIRDLHMDRLGLNSKDGNGNDVETVAEQYASRQVLRNQGLVGLYDLVTLKENGDAIKKYQDRFEKRIQEYIDNLDAKDPAKMKEVFDRSKDPKMREMIAKAEEKKAKAELGEEEKKPKAEKPEHEQVYDSLRTYDDMIDEVALKSKNKRLRDKYASMDDEYKKINSTNEFKATRFLNEHKDFKAYRQLMSDNSSTSKDINDLKKKMATSDADKRTEIMDKIRNLRNKYMEKQSKVR